MGQGSIVARQPAELHRRQFEMITNSGVRRPSAKSLETELLNPDIAAEAKTGAPRCFTHRGPSRRLPTSVPSDLRARDLRGPPSLTDTVVMQKLDRARADRRRC